MITLHIITSKFPTKSTLPLAFHLFGHFFTFRLPRIALHLLMKEVVGVDACAWVNGKNCGRMIRWFEYV